MKELMLILIGALISAFLCGLITSQANEAKESKHAKEIQRLTDSLAKCNGTLKDHICYPPYKNN